jgi:hypothetical protein
VILRRWPGDPDAPSCSAPNRSPHRASKANEAIGEIGPGDPITVDTLLRFHRRLMTGARHRAHAGRLRAEQNGIGGSAHNPCSADFAPRHQNSCRTCSRPDPSRAAQARTRDPGAATVRSGSATDLLLRSLPGAPILTVNGAAELTSRSFTQANEAVTRLAEAGILSQITAGRRNRASEAKAVVNALTDLERQLASPGGDTSTSEPSRPVTPRRPTSLFRVMPQP